MTQLVALLVLAAVGWWWWDSMQSREAAVAAARRACRTFSTQLLDDSVVLRRIRLRRHRGGLGLLRMYTFEFTREGDERRNGYASVLGRRVLDVHLDDIDADTPPPAGRTLH